MTDRQTQIAYETAAVAALQAAFDAAISDRRYSPDEETALHRLATEVGIKLNHDDATKAVLTRFRMLSAIDHAWRAGSLAVQRLTADVLTAIDTVEVYITSRQVLLFPDGLQLEKQTGRNVFLSGSADWELAKPYNPLKHT